MKRKRQGVAVIGLLLALGLSVMSNMDFGFRRQRLEARAELRLKLPTEAVVLNASCVESPSGNISILMPYNASQPVRHVWNDPLPKNNNLFLNESSTPSSASYAVCAFQGDRPYAFHLPHTMQQLYKCFSYWLAFPNKKPILLNTIKQHSRFVKGFTRALRDVFAVEWDENNNNNSNNNNSTTGKRQQLLQQYANVAVEPAETPAYAFLTSQHARTLADGVLRHYFAKKPTACPIDGPRIGILNRAKSRTFSNLSVLQQALQETFPSSPVHIVYFEESQFLDQVHFFAAHDIVVSPHGAQLAGIPFMPACSGLLEVFPARYYLPDYFQGLAQSSGIYHATLYLSNHSDPLHETAVARQQKQVAAARGVPLCPPWNKIREGVEALVELHYACCMASIS